MSRRRKVRSRRPARKTASEQPSSFARRTGVASAIAALLTGIGALLWLQPSPVGKEDFCSLDRSETGITVLLIDISDKLKPNQVERLKNEMHHIAAPPNNQESYLGKGEKLVVYFLDEEGNPPTKEFEMCNPGDLQDRGVNALFEGERFASGKWEEFSTRIISSIDNKLNLGRTMNTSPILEGIEFTRAKEFPPTRFLKQGKNYRVQVWSDMLQNSRKGNHFRQLESVDKTLSNTSLSLDGITIKVYHILSEKYWKFQTPEQLKWWEQFFFGVETEFQKWEPI